ncbi:hypothetical protein T01_8061 [Trichinella spiralis]|uniref:Uncharacterized protein n=1 Tax=Trichinella spiralis TaxID=6334 RepID=A0A0V0YXX8_TRISP|nr:hypothetical protein T01_8061 [Trichinella spiralis]
MAFCYVPFQPFKSGRAAVLYKYTLLKSGLISYCVALLGYFGASFQQLRCDC